MPRVPELLPSVPRQGQCLLSTSEPLPRQEENPTCRRGREVSRKSRGHIPHPQQEPSQALLQSLLPAPSTPPLCQRPPLPPPDPPSPQGRVTRASCSPGHLPRAQTGGTPCPHHKPQPRGEGTRTALPEPGLKGDKLKTPPASPVPSPQALPAGTLSQSPE